MASDINGGVINFSDCKFISRKQADGLRKGFSIEGDVLLSHKATIGRTAIVPKTQFPYIMLTPQVTYYRVINKEKLNNQFLKYQFDNVTFKKTLELWAGAGSTRAYIGITNQKNLPIKIPSIETQNGIAEALATIDKKIALNNKINTELEAMAKLIYDYWFVQFDFPDANGKPYKSSGGKMVYNEALKREIPEGWSVEELNQCVDTILDHRGKTPKKLGGDWTDNDDGIIALSAKLVKGGKLRNLEKANKVDRALFNKWMPEKLKDGDILMTSEAPAGEFYFIHGKTDYCMSQRLFGIRGKQELLAPTYLYYELSKGHGYSQILGSLSGSTVFGIRQDVLRTIKVVVPELALQKRFDEIVLPQLKQIKNLDQANIELSALRDWLLPMLMNGQVTVKDTAS
jgi:Restriction endonuclease S subunits